jgi:hypothetical protein
MELRNVTDTSIKGELKDPLVEPLNMEFGLLV